MTYGNAGAINTAIGFGALNINTGNYNTAIGAYSLIASTAAYNNTAVGANALGYDTSGGDNTAIGSSALSGNTNGAENTALGVDALLTNTTGSFNTAIGGGADVSSGGLINATAIGANAVVSESNALVLGGTGANAVRVGIGTSSPNAILQVNGSISLPIIVPGVSVDISAAPDNYYSLVMYVSGTTVTLPPVAANIGKIYIIAAAMRTGSVTISSDANLGRYVDNFGTAGTTSLAAGGNIMVQSDGSYWRQIK